MNRIRLLIYAKQLVLSTISTNTILYLYFCFYHVLVVLFLVVLCSRYITCRISCLIVVFAVWCIATRGSLTLLAGSLVCLDIKLAHHELNHFSFDILLNFLLNFFIASLLLIFSINVGFILYFLCFFNFLCIVKSYIFINSYSSSKIKLV